MKKYKIEVLTGFIIILTVTSIYFGINFLKKNNVYGTSYKLNAYFDNVAGLNKSNAVKINGLEIGHISDIKIAEDNTNRIIVTMSITNGQVFIPTNSKVKSENSILGSSSLIIFPGTSKKQIENGSNVEVIKTINLQEEISNRVYPVLSNLDSSISTISKLVDKSRVLVENGNKSILMINKLIENNTKNINRTIKNFEVVSTNIANEKEKIHNVLKNIDGFSEKLNKTDVQKISLSLLSNLEKMDTILYKLHKENKGTMSKLINEDSVYNNLNSSLKNLDLLLEDLRLNPGRYITIRKKRKPYSKN